MRFLRPVLAVATIALIAVAVVHQDPSPGALHTVHARVPELAGPGGCRGCHGGDGTAMAAACGSCHEAILGQVRGGTGLHGSLREGTACGTCHIEHRGGDHALVGDLAFARAGLEEPLGYDHRHGTGTPLVGRHAELGCDDCHRNAFAPVLAPGEARFLGLSRECRSCHEDAHRGAFGADCAGCHGQDVPFAAVPGFAHRSFVLDGAHAGLTCARCHPAAGPRSVAQVRGTRSLRPRECADCHDSPHTAASSVVFAEAGDCRTCHSTVSFLPATVGSSDHPRLAGGLGLPGRHAAADCAACHAPPRNAPRTLRDCRGCHESPHTSRFAEAAGDCADCHDPAAADFRRPEAVLLRAAHGATGFPLGVPHQEVACSACHVRERGLEITRPARRATGCAACHQDPHGGQFAERAGGCVDCHAETRFAPSRFDLAAHEQTGFRLTGAHRAVGCFQCHEQRNDGVRRFRGAPRECGSCHEDVHRGAFDGPGKPRLVRGAAGCARCHDTSGFRRGQGPEFDHRLWTGYQLDGRHARLACADCHGKVAARTGTPPHSGLSRDCASCHQDPHLGQFRQGGRTDCSRCHSLDRPFAEVPFDHTRQSKFTLDEQHRKLSCNACHRAVDLPGGGRAVRYRPLGQRCIDCHTPPGRRRR